MRSRDPDIGKNIVGVVLGCNNYKVIELLERAASAGAVVTQPNDRPWGIYSGNVRDPDGPLWEIIWHPDSTR